MRTLRIDIVSDIVCPWCYIGLANLQKALEAVGDEISVTIDFHPLQLNPGLPPEGELSADNIARKYGMTPEQARSRGGGVRAAAAEAGLAMAGRPDRLYDTFDAHRLLAWAREQGRQQEMKRALFDAYFERGGNISSADILVEAATEAGLDAAAAKQVLARGDFAAQVHDDEIEWRSEGIASVPTMVVDGEFVINGAQAPDRIERALRKLAAR
ncbi:Predicted dithiol-disulfide isomerase, DsbA family [Sphingomonas sp. OV641]|uniref:DsbA family oxidoreductase n=1 Tax=Sphingomonas sp. OV641 TaxID=1881068 RepID=UPI0008B68C87|nr:DsbA family oxidoreductase [Sphingomonas sp. OV641]SEI92656.1 Predicted dithiol-disulfide isomerase, DsbA family [Sphingomonas sp. OV641]